jgi:hypothetical protein
MKDEIEENNSKCKPDVRDSCLGRRNSPGWRENQRQHNARPNRLKNADQEPLEKVTDA